MREYVIFGLTDDDLKKLGTNGTDELKLIFKNGKFSHAETKLSFIQALRIRGKFKKWNLKGYHYELYLKKEVEV